MKNDLLHSCKACGKEISRDSPFCRHCGHPQRKVLAKWIVAGFVLLTLALYVAMFFMLHLVSAFCD